MGANTQRGEENQSGSKKDDDDPKPECYDINKAGGQRNNKKTKAKRPQKLQDKEQSKQTANKRYTNAW